MTILIAKWCYGLFRMERCVGLLRAVPIGQEDCGERCKPHGGDTRLATQPAPYVAQFCTLVPKAARRATAHYMAKVESEEVFPGASEAGNKGREKHSEH